MLFLRSHRVADFLVRVGCTGLEDSTIADDAGLHGRAGRNNDIATDDRAGHRARCSTRHPSINMESTTDASSLTTVNGPSTERATKPVTLALLAHNTSPS